jgi:starch synthase
VGGVGDVVRSLPVALADRGWQPTVLVPAYGSLHLLPAARLQAEFAVEFGGATHRAQLWQVPGPDARVTQLVLEHPLLAPQGPGQVYCHDDASQPFATDATKFAFFCAALAEYLLLATNLPQVVHLHDWHTGLYLALRAALPRLARLRAVRTVYTIHNLAMQGIRPIAGHPSALRSWFPDVDFDIDRLRDPRYADCINPMAIGIRLAASVNTVSPTYAQEILRPSDPALGFYGGEGLEADLQAAQAAGRLTGILNGCDYPPRRRRPGWQRLVAAMHAQVQTWQQGASQPAHAAALERLASLPRRRPAAVLVSVGRLTSQKAQLFLQADAAGNRAVDMILQRLGTGGVLLMLGSGDPVLEAEFTALMARHRNFVLLSGYAADLAEQLYRAGDLFLMPSSFEPCGISQMFAMRAGQPCVVHGVGGLADTVADGRTGFVFAGATPAAQAEQFVAAVGRAVDLKRTAPARWQELRAAASAEVFGWQQAAMKYETQLYAPTPR